MEINWLEYSVEIIEFLNEDTLREIDYGTLDLSRLRDRKLREVLHVFEELLRMELKVNYLENRTGLFRVEIMEDKFYYSDFDYVIEADSICELKRQVLAENRIWYVFDDILAGELMKV